MIIDWKICFFFVKVCTAVLVLVFYFSSLSILLDLGHKFQSIIYILEHVREPDIIVIKLKRVVLKYMRVC